MNYQYEELRFLAEKLGLDRPEVMNCLEKAIRNPDTIPIYKKHFLRLLKQQGLCLADLPEFPRLIEQDVHRDGIHIGFVGEGNNTQSLFLPLEIFYDQHTLISGITGAGKSVLVDIISSGLGRKGKKVQILDRADEHLGLIELFPLGVILAVDPGKLKINPLSPPPGVDRLTWKGEILNLLRSDFYLRNGSINELNSILSSLYANKIHPTIIDLHKAILGRNYRAGSRQAGYIESLRNRSQMFTDSYLTEAFLCQQGYPLEKIHLEKSSIDRVGKISDDLMSSFYVDLKLKWIQTYLEQNPHEITHDNVIIIEEAHRYFYKGIRNRSDIREPLMLSLAREVRKLGISLVFIDQIPSLLPRQLIGNIKTFITFRLVNTSCVNTISEACGFDHEQREAIPLLGNREAIIFSDTLSQPYKFRTRNFNLPKVSEEYINEKMEPVISSLPYVPIPETENEIDELETGSGIKVEKISSKKITLRPRRIWKEILEILVEVGFIGLTELYTSLHISPFFGRKVIKEMESLELIETSTVSFGRRGNATTFIVMRPKGAEFLGIKYEDIKLLGKGSTEHKVIQNIVSRGLNDSGKVTSVEHSMNGKSVDIAEFVGDRIIAYEMELDPQAPHILQNINKDLEAGFSEVIVISKNKIAENEIKDQIYRHLDWTQLSKVKFKLLREFV